MKKVDNKPLKSMNRSKIDLQQTIFNINRNQDYAKYFIVIKNM